MCVVLGKASLGCTHILVNQVQGRRFQAYLNNPHNLISAPNAMILPIPSSEPMGPANFVDGTGMGPILTRYGALFKRMTRSVGMKSGERSIQIFSSGSYTVVLVKNASFEEIRQAVLGLPEHLRPPVEEHQALFDLYHVWYPGWHIAFCAWNEEIDVDPIMFWYYPMDAYKEVYWIPGLDGHGVIPEVGARVKVNHMLVVGTDCPLGTPAEDIRSTAPIGAQSWLPSKVVGVDLSNGSLINGDWIVPLDASDLSHDWWRHRVPPPGMV